MAKLRISIKRKNGYGIVKLKIVVEKLQKTLLSSGRKSDSNYELEVGDNSNNYYVPEDVKEGHFVVIAVDEEEIPKRFVVPLSCLTNSRFLKLLEQAAEEYGFDHEGALTIHCHPSEIERIFS